MKAIYTPRDMLEAQALKDLLAQHHIYCHVAGEHLQGGIGELPAIGIFQLYTAEEDAERALKLIQDWLSASPDHPHITFKFEA